MQIDSRPRRSSQLRHTFSHVARFSAADKPASRYQEATIGMQPEVIFTTGRCGSRNSSSTTSIAPAW